MSKTYSLLYTKNGVPRKIGINYTPKVIRDVLNTYLRSSNLSTQNIALTPEGLLASSKRPTIPVNWLGSVLLGRMSSQHELYPDCEVWAIEMTDEKTVRERIANSKYSGQYGVCIYEYGGMGLITCFQTESEAVAYSKTLRLFKTIVVSP